MTIAFFAGGCGGAAHLNYPTVALTVPDDAPMRGPRDAPVVVQVFTDFQCPYCAYHVPTLDQLAQEFGPQIRIVYRSYPLPGHPEAMIAAEAALEVQRQAGDDAFWEFHDLLFSRQEALSRPDLERYAATIEGVSLDWFRRALDGGMHRSRVEEDRARLQHSGAREIGTPATIINGRYVVGARPYEVYQGLVEAELP
ncbi:MAG: thioredoxin domain-containing protein [Myxococcota bacterium]